MQEEAQINENRVVYLKVKNQGYVYECVGVLMSDNNETVQIAFNAKDDVVMDKINYNKVDVLEMKDYKPDLLLW